MLMAVASPGSSPARSCRAASRCRRALGRTRAPCRRSGALRARPRHARGRGRSRLPRLRSPGGGCQFLGTAATAQVVAEALGLTVPHAALAPSGQPIWLTSRGGRRRRPRMWQHGRTLDEVLTDEAIENAMLVHAAFGGSTNLLIHIPAIAHGRPAAADGRRLAACQQRGAAARRRAPQRTAEPPDGAGLPRRRRPRGDAPPAPARLLHGDAQTVLGRTWDDVLDEWEASERRARLRAIV